MWFNVKAVDATFIDRARRHFTYDFTVQGTPDEVFVAITDPARFSSWFPDFEGARMVTAEPHGVGSVREVELKLVSVRERYLVYEPGVRFTFCVVATTLPLMTRMVEDFRLEPASDGAGTRVLWTIAYRPRTVLTPLVPVIRPVFGRMFEQATDRLKAHMAGVASTAA